MNHMAHATAGTFIVLLIVSLGGAVADDFAIDWYTVDGGGETASEGGGYSLEGTIGQPDASVSLTGGRYELAGGFWPAITDGCPALFGDSNGDGDVDLDDYSVFQACLAGAGSGLGAGCECLDLDDNGSVDLLDFAEFQVAFTGS